ncbi:hypothetical protein Taro_010882 [Colocasia esculenta]|uniref:Uncharacterized protein n=1 Tax=Colocasia esculenta TaxID=4460 RepID=A0A843U4U4_COLES|nr:hypothetical protein [Colocasia esculenta]
MPKKGAVVYCAAGIGWLIMSPKGVKKKSGKKAVSTHDEGCVDLTEIVSTREFLFEFLVELFMVFGVEQNIFQPVLHTHPANLQ